MNTAFHSLIKLILCECQYRKFTNLMTDNKIESEIVFLGSEKYASNARYLIESIYQLFQLGIIHVITIRMQTHLMGLKKSLLNTAFAYTVQSFDIFNN